jgi:hypothetical protein
MVQKVLEDEAWLGRLTKEDYRGLTPLFYAHVESYGTLRLDMEKRLALARISLQRDDAGYHKSSKLVLLSVSLILPMKVARCAAARELLHIAFAIVKNEEDFDPLYETKPRNVA